MAINRIIIRKDGFIWFDVTDQAFNLRYHNIFELYVLHDDGTESLVESGSDILDALKCNKKIAIEAGNYNEQ